MTTSYPAALVSHPDNQRGHRAIKWALDHLRPGDEPLLWIPRKMDLPNEPAFVEFAKKYPVISAKGRSGSWSGGPVIAAWPDAEQLAEIAVMPRMTALVVLEWNPKYVSAWVAATHPEMLTPAGAAPPTPSALDPVVRVALRSCTHPVNPAQSMSGTLDRRDVIRAIKTLRSGGYRMDPSAVFAWAVAEGWGSGAKDLRDAVAKANKGVNIQARPHDTSPNPRALAYWREEAASGGSGEPEP